MSIDMYKQYVDMYIDPTILINVKRSQSVRQYLFNLPQPSNRPFSPSSMSLCWRSSARDPLGVSRSANTLGTLSSILLFPRSTAVEPN